MKGNATAQRNVETYDRDMERTAKEVARIPRSSPEDRKRLAEAIKRDAGRILSTAKPGFIGFK